MRVTIQLRTHVARCPKEARVSAAVVLVCAHAAQTSMRRDRELCGGAAWLLYRRTWPLREA